MKWFIIIIVFIWLARFVFRAAGNYHVVRSPKTSRIRLQKRTWTTVFVGRYGKCVMFMEQQKKLSDQSGAYQYRIKRLPF